MATSLKDLIRGDVALARAIFGDERKRRLIPKLQEEGWPFFSIGRKRCAFPADLAAYARKTTRKAQKQRRAARGQRRGKSDPVTSPAAA
jgi:hypothetical protein